MKVEIFNEDSGYVNDALYFAAKNFESLKREIEELADLQLDSNCSNYFLFKNGHASDDGAAIFGKEGHIFINDGANHWADQLLGKYPDVHSIAASYANILKNRVTFLQNKGINYRHLIVPEKDVIYSELSPNLSEYNISNERVSIKLIQNDLVENLCYPIDFLLNVKKYGYIFLKRNSHFNFFGGYFMAKIFLNSMGYDLPLLSEIKFKNYKWPDDLSMKFNANLITTRPVLVTDAVETLISDGQNGGHVGKKLFFKNESAIYDKKILIFGDSYSWNPDAGLARFCSLIFKEVYFNWMVSIDYDLIAEFKPDVVITESAERFHIKTPNDRGTI